MDATKIVTKLLRLAAESIESNRVSLDDEEIGEMIAMFSHRKINIEQTCQRYGISRATLNRWQENGKLPPFRKDSGGKVYLWQDEADRCVSAYENGR